MEEYKPSKTIWTIGHSTHLADTFMAMLQSFDIVLLADVRSFPCSRKFPQFNRENLEKVLPENGIEYKHLKALGGRRKIMKNSINARWRNTSFRAYADYAETPDYSKALLQLKAYAMLKRAAYMCSEAVWWRCHRSIISDYLKIKGWKVMHISGIAKALEHPFTSAARIEDDKLFYYDKGLFEE